MDGQDWTPQHPSGLPLATIQYQMALGRSEAQLVLFDTVTFPQPPQTWVWTGSNWERKG